MSITEYIGQFSYLLTPFQACWPQPVHDPRTAMDEMKKSIRRQLREQDRVISKAASIVKQKIQQIRGLKRKGERNEVLRAEASGLVMLQRELARAHKQKAQLTTLSQAARDASLQFTLGRVVQGSVSAQRTLNDLNPIGSVRETARQFARCMHQSGEIDNTLASAFEFDGNEEEAAKVEEALAYATQDVTDAKADKIIEAVSGAPSAYNLPDKVKADDDRFLDRVQERVAQLVV